MSSAFERTRAKVTFVVDTNPNYTNICNVDHLVRLPPSGEAAYIQ
jgi:hypothetical protein